MSDAQTNRGPAFPQPLAAAVLQFWFGEPEADCAVRFRGAWFAIDPDFDREIAARFGEAFRQAIAGDFDAMTDDAEGALAA